MFALNCIDQVDLVKDFVTSLQTAKKAPTLSASFRRVLVLKLQRRS